ncbi:MAG TPA: hypothetical protein VKB38_14255 [Terracidiphilus sp.]|nr:hypothetical protein [Terracidiphilus sp.]
MTLRPLGLLLILAASVAAAQHATSRAQNAPAQTNTGDEAGKAKEQLQSVEEDVSRTNEHLASTDKEIAHLEQELMILLAASGISIAVIVAVTLFGSFRLKDAVKEYRGKTADALGIAKRDIDKATSVAMKRIADAVKEAELQKEEVTRLAEKAKQSFPKLADLEEQVRKSLEYLEKEFPKLAWEDDRYRLMAIERRQRILTVEHLIALEFAEPPPTAPQLRKMANFYYSKYQAEKFASDLDRALYYALIAAARGNGEFQYDNDLGLIYMELAEHDPALRDRARDSFLASQRKRPNQQRCYYNLGRLYYDEAMLAKKQGDAHLSTALLEKARNQTKTGLQATDWEDEPVPRWSGAVHYNLACILCRLSAGQVAPQGPSPVLDEAVDHLRKAAQYQGAKLATVIYDFENSEGDLFDLAANAQYTAAVHGIREDFKRVWNA